jgi:hypothetical protein
VSFVRVCSINGSTGQTPFVVVEFLVPSDLLSPLDVSSSGIASGFHPRLLAAAVITAGADDRLRSYEGASAWANVVVENDIDLDLSCRNRKYESGERSAHWALKTI